MGNQKLLEQGDAYTAYVLLGSKKKIREMMQLAIATREEEIQQAGNSVGEVMSYSYLGYRMGLEDLYYGLYDEELPEVKQKSTIDWEKVNV